MKITKRQLRKIIKEEAADCIKDYMLMGYTRSQAAKECGDDDGGYYDRSRYQPKPRKTSYVGAPANVEKIEAISLALDEKPGNKFLTSIYDQLVAGRGLSSKQNAVVRKILNKIDPDSAKLFESSKIKITKNQLRRIIREVGIAPGVRQSLTSKLYEAIIGVLSRRPGMSGAELVDTVNQMHPSIDAELIYDFLDQLQEDDEVFFNVEEDEWSLT